MSHMLNIDDLNKLLRSSGYKARAYEKNGDTYLDVKPLDRGILEKTDWVQVTDILNSYFPGAWSPRRFLKRGDKVFQFEVEV